MNVYSYETVPRLYGQFLAYMLHRWEMILRESAIFGILRVATLGFYVMPRSRSCAWTSPCC